MKKLIGIMCLSIAIVSTAVRAADTLTPASINPIMSDIGKLMLSVYPLFAAPRAITDKEKEQISQALEQMAVLFQEAAPAISTRPEGYQIAYEFISEYIAVVIAVLNTRHIDYARSHFFAIGEICASCHTQDTTLRTLFRGVKREVLSSDYAYAELNYMTRDYREALNYYEKYLNSSALTTELQIIQPLQRIVTIYAQVQNQPEEGVKVLEKYTSLKQHTELTKTELNNWITGLKALQSSGVDQLEKMGFVSLQGFVAKYLGDLDKLSLQIESTAQQEVARVWLRGQLYHYLNVQATDEEIPMLLYWLAVTDRSIAYNYYFSLAELYLKQCVLKYARHPYAKRCYAEYQNYVNHTYARQGEKVPVGIQQELELMRRALTRAP